MSKISKLIGEVIEGKPKFDHATNDGEKFYTIRVQFLDAEIDVMFSEYLLEDKFSDKIEVTGYLASTPRKNASPRFYFYGNQIKSVDIDTPITNELNFSYRVTKAGEFKQNQRCTDILPLVASDYTALHTTSVLYLCARGKVARKLKGKEKGYYVNGRGYLKQYRDIYEVLIVELEDENTADESTE